MERKNILKETNGGMETLTAMDFIMLECDGNVNPLIRLVDGSLYQANGATFCIKADDFGLDPVAQAWFGA